MDKEILATSAIENLLSRSDYLSPIINSNDKTPSLDGVVNVYRKPSDNHKKEDLIIRVPIQIKYRENNELQINQLSFPVEIADLHCYLQCGGTIFFVVCMNQAQTETAIFFKQFLPANLKLICKDCNKKKTKTIKFKKLPKDTDDITNIFFNFASDMQKQKAVTSSDKSPDDLIKNKQIDKFSLSFIDVKYDPKKPLDYLFKNEVYAYAYLKEYNIPIPLGKRILKEFKREINSPITINGKPFYDKYILSEKIDCREIHIGKGINIRIPTISFTLNGTLLERIKDLEFIINLAENKSFEINGKKLEIENDSQNELKKLLEQKHILLKMKKIQSALNHLHVQKELNIESLDESSKRNLQCLVDSVMDDCWIPAQNINSPRGIIDIGNLTIIVYLLLNQDGSSYQIKNFYNSRFSCTDVDGNKYVSTYAVFLKKEIILTASNIDYSEIIKSIKTTKKSSILINHVNIFLLEMLHAYDESQNSKQKEEILDAANKIAEWLITVGTDELKDIYQLNYLQIKKRRQNLSGSDYLELTKMLEVELKSEERMDKIVAIYLLKDEQSSAEYYFNKMSKDSQDTFKKFPIYRFWRKHKNLE